MIWAALPQDLRATTRPIAARDYWTASPFKHWITREVFHAVYVARQRTDDQDPLEPLFDALEHGDSLVIFPEGEIYHHHRRLDPLNEGVASILLKVAGRMPAGKSAAIEIMPMPRIKIAMMSSTKLNAFLVAEGVIVSEPPHVLCSG